VRPEDMEALFAAAQIPMMRELKVLFPPATMEHTSIAAAQIPMMRELKV